MRTVTNTFLFNLSVADLLMSSMNGAPNFLSMLRSDWTLGLYYCSVNNFMAYATVASSVFTLVAISFDRYVAIVRPLHRRNSRKKARLFLFVIWSLSSALSFPGLVYSVTDTKRYDVCYRHCRATLLIWDMVFGLNSSSYHSGKTRTVCYVQWPDGRYPHSATDYM